MVNHRASVFLSGLLRLGTGSLILSACGQNELFNDGSEHFKAKRRSPPLTFEVDTEHGQKLKATQYCRPDHQGIFSDNTVMISEGMRPLQRARKTSVFFSNGGGCIRRPLREVWAASLNWGSIQWNHTGRAQVQSMQPPSPSVLLNYRVHYRVNPIPFVVVDWSLDWQHILKTGTVEQPVDLLIQFTKTSGTSHITAWNGSIELNELSPDLTSFALDVELLATGKGSADPKNQVFELHEKLKRAAPNWSALQ